MKYCFEWKAQRAIDVCPGDYFESFLLTNGQVLAESYGHDQFELNALLLPGKRIAGLGRSQKYQLENMPAGLGAIEAAPSKDIALDCAALSTLAFKLTTNIILDQGILAQQVSLDIIPENKARREIPLNRPDVAIDWISRGSYIINIPII